MSRRWQSLLPLSPFLLGGMVFLLAPWFTMTTIACYRIEARQGSCRVLQTAIGLPVKVIPLDTIQNATVTATAGRFTEHRLVIHTREGEFRTVPLHPSAPVRRSAIALNTFLTNLDQPSLRITQEAIGEGLLWGTLFLGLGAGLSWWESHRNV